MSERVSHIEIKSGSERGFGIVFALVFAVIGLYPLWGGGEVRIWALVISLLFLVPALFVPRILAVPNRLWFRFGLFLGAIVAPIVMALLYLAMVTPTGLIMRLLGKDLLNQKIDKEASSYWIERDEPVRSMKNQF